MSKSIKVDIKTINAIIKAIDVHLNLLSNSELYTLNNKEKIEISIEYLDAAKKHLAEILEKAEIKNLKQNAYMAYLDAKKSYSEALKTKDQDLIKQLKDKKDLILKHYIEIKDL